VLEELIIFAYKKGMILESKGRGESVVSKCNFESCEQIWEKH
jgi:hypothetical protein